MAQIEKPILNPKGELRWLRPEASKLLRSSWRYTRFVSFSKLLLGGLSLLLIGSIVLLPMLGEEKDNIRLAFEPSATTQAALPVMTKPTFQGVDDKNQPFYVTADKAVQLDGNQIALSKVQGDMITNDKAWMSVKAAKGQINNQTKQLWLSEGVELIHQDGYELKTKAVLIDLNSRIAQGATPVVGSGPAGRIEANRFYWDHNAQKLRFEGNVKMKVNAKRAR